MTDHTARRTELVELRDTAADLVDTSWELACNGRLLALPIWFACSYLLLGLRCALWVEARLSRG